MKKIGLFILPLAAVFASQLASRGADRSASSGTKGSQQPAPVIRFLRPVKGEHFFDFPIFVQVEVSGFRLVPPDPQSSKNPPANAGHILYSMDDFPAYASDGTQVMLGKTIGNKYLPVGWHVIKVQLVDVNDRPLNPPVTAVTSIFSSHPALVEADHAEKGSQKAELNSQELYQMHIHLKDLQDELLRLKTGIPGYVPSPTNTEGHTGD